MAVRKWKGDEAARLIRAGFVRNLHAAAILVQNHAKELISVAGTMKADAGRDRKGRFRRQYGANPSAPGEPPHKQTGHLRRSVARDVDSHHLTARVGTNLKYGRWLELGTRFMAARPWLRRAFNEVMGQVKQVLARRPPGL